MLDIIVARATDLVDVSPSDGLLPFVVIKLGRHKKKSQRGSGTNPVWNQAFRMEWPHKAWSLSFTVWHEDLLLGSCRVELVEVLQRDCLEKHLPLITDHGTQQGGLHVRLMPQILGVMAPVRTPESLTRRQASIRTQPHPSCHPGALSPHVPHRTPSHSTVEHKGLDPLADARPSIESLMPVRPSVDSLLDARPSMDSSIWDPRPSFDSLWDDRPSFDSLCSYPGLQPPTPPRTPLTSPLPRYPAARPATPPNNTQVDQPPSPAYLLNPAYTQLRHTRNSHAPTPAAASTPRVEGRSAPLATPTHRRTPTSHSQAPSSPLAGSSPASTLDLRFPLLPNHPGSGGPLFLEPHPHTAPAPAPAHPLTHRQPRTYHNPGQQPPSPLHPAPRRDAPFNLPSPEPYPASTATPFRSTHIVTRNRPHPHSPNPAPSYLPHNSPQPQHPITPPPPAPSLVPNPQPNLLHTGPRGHPPHKLSLAKDTTPRSPPQPPANPTPHHPIHHTGSEGTVRLSYPRHHTGSDSIVTWSLPRNSRHTGSDSALKLSYPRPPQHTGSDSTIRPPLPHFHTGSDSTIKVLLPRHHTGSDGTAPPSATFSPLHRSSAGSIHLQPTTTNAPPTRTIATTGPKLRNHSSLPPCAPTPPPPSRSPSPTSTPHSHLSSRTPSLATSTATDYSQLAPPSRRNIRTPIHSQFSTDLAYGAAHLYTDEDAPPPPPHPILSIHSQFSTDLAYGAAHLHTSDDPALSAPPDAAHHTIHSLLSTASSLTSPPRPLGAMEGPDVPLLPNRASRSTIQSQQSTVSTAHSPMIPRTPQQQVGLASGGTLRSRTQHRTPAPDAAPLVQPQYPGGTLVLEYGSSFGSSAESHVAQLLGPTPVPGMLTPEASVTTSHLQLRPVPQGRFPWQEQHSRTNTASRQLGLGPEPGRGCTCGACSCRGQRGGGGRKWGGGGCLSQMLCITSRHRCVCCSCECGLD